MPDLMTFMSADIILESESVNIYLYLGCVRKEELQSASTIFPICSSKSWTA
jgi:hypothetical protein